VAMCVTNKGLQSIICSCDIIFIAAMTFSRCLP